MKYYYDILYIPIFVESPKGKGSTVFWDRCRGDRCNSRGLFCGTKLYWHLHWLIDFILPSLRKKTLAKQPGKKIVEKKFSRITTTDGKSECFHWRNSDKTSRFLSFFMQFFCLNSGKEKSECLTFLLIYQRERTLNSNHFRRIETWFSSCLQCDMTFQKLKHALCFGAKLICMKKEENRPVLSEFRHFRHFCIIDFPQNFFVLIDTQESKTSCSPSQYSFSYCSSSI